MPNEMLPAIAAYFRACYQADFRAIHLLNFFSKKVEYPLFLSEADLLTGQLFRVPIDSEWARQADAYLDIYSREKALYAGAFFLCGRSRVLGRNHSVCAPLLIYPLTLELEDEVYYLKADTTNPTLNPAVIEVLNRSDNNASATQEELAKHLPIGPLDFDQCYQLERAFTDLFPNVEVSTLAEFPELLLEDDVRSLLKKTKRGFQILSAIGIGIVDKGKGARGVLNELEMLAQGNDWSRPLQTLFSEQPVVASKAGTESIWAPAVLSEAQEEVVRNAYRYPLSLVIGPPGTGKTFTIASLAVDLMSKGQSVLIASRNNQAVKVVAEKIEADLGLPQIVVKATSGNYRKAVKDRLKEWYRGFGLEEYRKSDVRIARQEVMQRDRRIQELVEHLLRWEHKIMDWGAFVAGGTNGLWSNVKRWFIRNSLGRSVPFWKSVMKLERMFWLRRKFMIEYLRINFFYRLVQVLRNRRKEVRNLIAALSARTGNKQANIFDEMDVSVILQCLPIWITNTADIHQMLPAYTEMFDVVIIDEASQCDIASALPVLQRAKRAVIVGDPKQLRHISFVPQRQQQIFREQYGLEKAPGHWLDYRNQSLLDLVEDQLTTQDQVKLLDEHFRSLPDIIAFSNRHFYSNQLRVMTATPDRFGEKNVHLRVVAGQRTGRGDNAEEVKAVVEMIDSILQKEKELDAALCQSIGVLSPFRGQVEAIQNAIAETFSADQLLRHRVLIGSPFAFQGEERDVMLISFAVHPGSPGGVWTYLNREDVFNVSITRARAEQYLFLSGAPKDFPDGNMLRAYLDFLEFRREAAARSPESGPGSDQFMGEVLQQLSEWGIDQVHTHYSIGGVELDLVVVHEGRSLGIDLMGFPGPFTGLIPIEHWKILSRVGVPVFALPYINWLFQPETSRAALKNYLLTEQI
ncbi:DEAD/DEAH box helicase [Flavilitoribacter nigricans]|nr:AAA domain-containing protein [Flavilitoribacter nigricans]